MRVKCRKKCMVHTHIIDGRWGRKHKKESWYIRSIVEEKRKCAHKESTQKGIWYIRKRQKENIIEYI